MSIPEPKMPSTKAVRQAHEALETLRALPQKRGERVIQVRPASGKAVSVSVPREAFELFLEVLGTLATGNAATIVPVNAELTTQQAADILNVSRPHIVHLLDHGYIPHRKVGSHRRVKVADLLEYKRRSDAEGRKAARELTQQAQKLGMGY